MKYIFRTALLNRFSSQPVVSREDLEEALKKSKYPKEDLDTLLQHWNVIVDNLVISAERQEDKVISIINQHLEESLNQNQIKDIVTIWLSQYEQVYSYKLKSFLPYSHLEGIQWSVNTKFMSKRMDKMSESVAILNLRLSDPTINSRAEKVITFEMDKDQLNSFYEQLGQIQSRVDELMGLE